MHDLGHRLPVVRFRIFGCLKGADNHELIAALRRKSLMRKHVVSLLLAVAVVACRPDPVVPEPPVVVPPTSPTGILKVTLVPEWEGEALVRFQEYRNFMDYRTTVETLTLYFGDVRGISGEDTTYMKDVDLFVLHNGPHSRSWTVPVGTYDRVRAALGVPATLNYADPANYGQNHPLSVSNGTYWTWATGYRYVMFEGRYDPDPQSTATLVNAYVIHPGMEPSYIEFELERPGGLTITEGGTTEVTVRVAVDRIFHSDAYQIDLATENTAHGGNLPLQWKLVNNVVKSFTVE
jgi:hypothetical protein